MSLYILNSIRLITGPIRHTKRGLVFAKNWNLSPIIPKTDYVKCFSTNRGKIREWSTWKGIITRFVPIGLCLIAVMQWRAYRKFSADDQIAKNWEVTVYCALPLRTASRCWGWIADKHLPEPIRPYIYGLYSNTFGVNIAEAADEDFKSYQSLADFFTRALKEGVRIVDPTSCLVSPCDGTVLHFGPVNNGYIEQVKGVTYSLENFLGENTWKNNTGIDYRTSIMYKSDQSSNLYQCVIYLAPGDYHRFHSPSEWQPTHRRHFPGQLLSVKPTVAQWLPGLFCLNERAVYLGQWACGFFSMTAVGATNVGSIKVYCDKTLQTNRPKYKQSYLWKDKCLGSNISLKKGDPFGEFRMGSTIVLLFEAPANFRFNVVPGQKVLMGQSICCVARDGHVDRVTNTRAAINNAS